MAGVLDLGLSGINLDFINKGKVASIDQQTQEQIAITNAQALTTISSQKNQLFTKIAIGAGVLIGFISILFFAFKK